MFIFDIHMCINACASYYMYFNIFFTLSVKFFEQVIYTFTLFRVSSKFFEHAIYIFKHFSTFCKILSANSLHFSELFIKFFEQGI